MFTVLTKFVISILAIILPCAVHGQTRAPKFFAVVVGVTKYDGTLAREARLDEGANNVKRALEQYARRAGYSEQDIHVDLHVDRDPASKSPKADVAPNVILRALHNAAVRSQDPRDTLVFFFTGHGSRQDGIMYLYASGAREGDNSDYVEIPKLLERFNMSRAGTKLVFIDACQVLVDPSALASSPSLYGVIEMNSVKPQGVAIFYASSKGEPAQIDERVKYGYFTKHLVSVLARSDASGVSPTGLRFASDLDEHLKKNVRIDVSASAKRPQEPYASIEGALKYDLFPLVKNRSDAASVAGAPLDRRLTTVYDMAELNYLDHSSFSRRYLALGDNWFFRPVSNVVTSLDFKEKTLISVCGENRMNLRMMPACTLPSLSDRFTFKWDAILVSVGINDLTSTEFLSNFLTPECRSAVHPDDCIRPGGFAKFATTVRSFFSDLVALRDRVDSQNKGVPVFVHTYSYPVPETILNSTLVAGPQFRQMLEYAEVPIPLWNAIARRMLDSFADSLFALGLPNVFVVDTRETLNAKNWAAPTVPNHSGFSAIAKVWAEALENRK